MLTATGGKRTFGFHLVSPKIAGLIQIMRWPALANIAPIWRITRARIAEANGQWDRAQTFLTGFSRFQRYAALMEVYDARLASIRYAELVTYGGLARNPSDDMQRLLAGIRGRHWYLRPKDANERYLARYVDYIEAGILGEGAERRSIALELHGSPVRTLVKKLLLAA